MNFIKIYVLRNKIINAKRIIFLIKDKFNVTMSLSYFYSYLKKINLTHKKVYLKKQPYSNKKYKIIKNIFFKQIKNIDKDEIYSIDETAVYLNSINNHGWAIKGQKCIIKDKNKQIYNKKYSLSMAISNKKVISYVLHEKSINGEKYLDFIKKIVDEHGNKNTLLMDNATIHKTKIFTEYCKEANVNVLYNIPYNPESNPIEMIFCPIKKFIKSNNTKSITAINDSIDDYIKNISKDSLKKMFNKSLCL